MTWEGHGIKSHKVCLFLMVLLHVIITKLHIAHCYFSRNRPQRILPTFYWYLVLWLGAGQYSFLIFVPASLTFKYIMTCTKYNTVSLPIDQRLHIAICAHYLTKFLMHSHKWCCMKKIIFKDFR